MCLMLTGQVSKRHNVILMACTNTHILEKEREKMMQYNKNKKKDIYSIIA